MLALGGGNLLPSVPVAAERAESGTEEIAHGAGVTAEQTEGSMGENKELPRLAIWKPPATGVRPPCDELTCGVAEKRAARGAPLTPGSADAGTADADEAGSGKLTSRAGTEGSAAGASGTAAPS